VSAVCDFVLEPDAYGDRAALLAALTTHYGPLTTSTRYRPIINPDANLARELELDTGAPAVRHRRLIETARGRLLMTETEATPAFEEEIEQV
jgi:hypothetical protein